LQSYLHYTEYRFSVTGKETAMPRLIVVRHSGDEIAIEGQAGRSVMEVMRDNGIEELLALCGGCCSCATCHVWIDPVFLDRLSEPTKAENELLDNSEHRKSNSRLSCQIKLTDDLDGLRLTVPPSD
jgi:2Fe-2S ferredoxin